MTKGIHELFRIKNFLEACHALRLIQMCLILLGNTRQRTEKNSLYTNCTRVSAICLWGQFIEHTHKMSHLKRILLVFHWSSSKASHCRRRKLHVHNRGGVQQQRLRIYLVHLHNNDTNKKRIFFIFYLFLHFRLRFILLLFV